MKLLLIYFESYTLPDLKWNHDTYVLFVCVCSVDRSLCHRSSSYQNKFKMFIRYFIRNYINFKFLINCHRFFQNNSTLTIPVFQNLNNWNIQCLFYSHHQILEQVAAAICTFIIIIQHKKQTARHILNARSRHYDSERTRWASCQFNSFLHNQKVFDKF